MLILANKFCFCCSEILPNLCWSNHHLILDNTSSVYSKWKLHSTSAPEPHTDFPSLSILCMCVNYLVSMVSADVAECGGSWLTEQCRAVALRAIHDDVLGVRDIGEWWREDGRGTSRGGRGGCEAGQALCQTVHVDLDLWVVKIFLSITVVWVTVSPVGRRNRKSLQNALKTF